MDPRIVEAVRRMKVALQELGVRAHAVVLFGSHAAGRAEEHSDVDLAVISDDFQGMDLLHRLELIGSAMARARIVEPIEALAYTCQEYDQAQPGTLLSDEVKAKGVQVP